MVRLKGEAIIACPPIRREHLLYARRAPRIDPLTAWRAE
jgi:hypothetical protein